MKKLVRDKIPSIIKKEGRKVSFVQYKDKGKLIGDNPKKIKQLVSSFFLKKIQEEIKELNRAKNKEEQIEELADVVEVLEGYFQHEGNEGEEFSITKLKQIYKLLGKIQYKELILLKTELVTLQIIFYMNTNNITFQELSRVKNKKKKEKGSFKNVIVMEIKNKLTLKQALLKSKKLEQKPFKFSKDATKKIIEQVIKGLRNGN